MREESSSKQKASRTLPPQRQQPLVSCRSDVAVVSAATSTGRREAMTSSKHRVKRNKEHTAVPSSRLSRARSEIVIPRHDDRFTMRAASYHRSRRHGDGDTFQHHIIAMDDTDDHVVVVPRIGIARNTDDVSSRKKKRREAAKMTLYDDDEQEEVEIVHNATSTTTTTTTSCDNKHDQNKNIAPRRKHASRRQQSSSSSSSEQMHVTNNNKTTTGSGVVTQQQEQVKSKGTSSKEQLELLVLDYNADDPLVPKRHFAWMPFGHGRTWIGILLLAMGIVLATLAKRSTAFVTLGDELILSPQMEPISNVGLVRLNLCYSQDYLETLEQQSDTQEAAMPPYMNSNDAYSADDVTRDIPHTSCFTIRLGSDIVEDTMWEVSRASASFAIALGTFFCLLMISTICWESINMKPMAAGLLVTYLFQSFSFFFYDSELCRENSCKLAVGTYFSILASFCWFGASMVCIVMDVYHTRKMRRLAKLERRRRRRLRRELRRKTTELTTTPTETSFSSDGGTSSFHSSSLEDSPSRLSSPIVQEEEIVDSEGDVLWKV